MQHNIRSWIGVKAEFMAYTTSAGFENQFTHLKAYFAGNANLFTCTFGPLVKKQWINDLHEYFCESQ